jgi:translation initiation factor 2 subunit 3
MNQTQNDPVSLEWETPYNRSQEDLQPSINIGTIGHVAHGKSTLVKAMTGVRTAKFNKELERNMTIKLGYANCKIWRCNVCQPHHYQSTDSKQMLGTVICYHCGADLELVRHISFVDCPGHEVLMATMLNGATVMDGALLMIAADQTCPQPQTAEHLAAASMMGLHNYVVLQNKVDLVNENKALENYTQIKTFLKTSPSTQQSPIIPISAQQGLNMEHVCRHLANMEVPPRDLTAPPLMIVVRSFDVNRPGESNIDALKGGVAGGSLIRGTLKAGMKIEIRPGRVIKKDGKFICCPLQSEVVTMLSDTNALQIATPGGLIAVGTKLDPSLARGDGLKGQVIGVPGSMPPVFVSLEVSYLKMKRVVGLQKPQPGEKTHDGAVRPLRKGEVVRLNIGSATVDGNVTATKADLVKLQLKTPVCAELGEKLSISRQIGQGHHRLIGVGVIRAGDQIPLRQA